MWCESANRNTYREKHNCADVLRILHDHRAYICISRLFGVRVSRIYRPIHGKRRLRLGVKCDYVSMGVISESINSTS